MERIKYIQPYFLPICDRCKSNIMLNENYYFVAIEYNDARDVRVVHRECYVRNQTYWAREELEGNK